MGFISNAVDKITGKDAKEDAERAARKAREEAERRAREQAELEAAQNAAKTAGGAEELETEVGSEETKQSAKKKKLRGGKKGLSVARASGSGINI